MELRWMYYPLGTAPKATAALHLGTLGQSYAMVLQYRDGITHDCEWLDVPTVFYTPPTE